MNEHRSEGTEGVSKGGEGLPDPVPHRTPASSDRGRPLLGIAGTSGVSEPSADALSVSRRGLLAGTGASLAASVAGCGAFGDGSTPAAVSVGDQASCDVCGMIISKHPGPNGQVFYADHDPEEHDPPFRFDSLQSCAFDHYFKNQDWSVEVFYVTDYSKVGPAVFEDGGQSFVSGYESPESFANAESVSYVVDSDVRGAMGPDFVPFSDEADANDFVDRYGGRIVSFEDVSPAMLK